jgi:hypothetical protein
MSHTEDTTFLTINPVQMISSEIRRLFSLRHFPLFMNGFSHQKRKAMDVIITNSDGLILRFPQTYSGSHRHLLICELSDTKYHILTIDVCREIFVYWMVLLA